jgi:hypothetical protein
LQIYLDPDVELHLKEWRSNRSPLTDSAALNELLREFFGIDKPEPIQAFDWRWAINEAIAPLVERIEALEAKWIEAEAQAKQEKESPQATSLLQEALETCQQQMYVIEQLQRDIAQKDIELLNDSPGESPGDEIEEMAEDGFSGTPEDLEAEIAEQDAYELAMGGFPNIDNPFKREPDAHQKAIARLLAEHPDCQDTAWLYRRYLDRTPAFISQETFELFVAEMKSPSDEQTLMDAIYEKHATISVEEAEAIYRLIKEGDFSSDSPGELKEKLTHNELAKRLDRKPATLRRERNQPDFSAWSQQKDPMGLAWQWDGTARVYRGFKIKSI